MKTSKRLNELVELMLKADDIIKSHSNEQELGKKIRESFMFKTITPKWAVEEHTEEGPIIVALFESLPHAKMYADFINEVEKGEKTFKIHELQISGEAHF
jgi:hypothetical protein